MEFKLSANPHKKNSDVIRPTANSFLSVDIEQVYRVYNLHEGCTNQHSPSYWRHEYNYLNAACMFSNEIPNIFNAILFSCSLLPVKWNTLWLCFNPSFGFKNAAGDTLSIS